MKRSQQTYQCYNIFLLTVFIQNTLLARVGLQRDGHKLASELSGGMKRRLSVAISLTGDPAIVILDEPTT